MSGGTLTGNVTFSTDSTLAWSRNTDNFSIGFKNTGDSDADSYGWMKMADNGNEYFKWLQVSGSTTTELMSLKSDGLRFKGTKVSLEGHSHSYAGSSSAGGAATSATKLQTARTINGTSFNGTANITTANWGTTRSIYIQDATATNTSSAVSVNGGGNAYLKLPTNIKVGTLTATGEVTAYSDIRLKTDIQPLENRGYIKPVTYKKDGKDSIGFIAQEVRELYPELVIEDNTEDKYLSVNYAQYVAVLQAQIIDLKKEIDELKNIKTK